jgi:hypothetical protein
MQTNQRLSLERPGFSEEEALKIREAGIDRVFCRFIEA